jgi:hypothetical protein
MHHPGCDVGSAYTAAAVHALHVRLGKGWWAHAQWSHKNYVHAIMITRITPLCLIDGKGRRACPAGARSAARCGDAGRVAAAAAAPAA